jgi:protein-S-isoprenylcysteine O-methyltransferase Ste14
VCALLGLALLALAWASPFWVAAAALLILVPTAALWRQRVGERRLQNHLSGLLGDCTWNPRPH